MKTYIGQTPREVFSVRMKATVYYSMSSYISAFFGEIADPILRGSKCYTNPTRAYPNL